MKETFFSPLKRIDNSSIDPFFEKSLPLILYSENIIIKKFGSIEISATKMKRISIGNQILTKKLERGNEVTVVWNARCISHVFSWFLMLRGKNLENANIIPPGFFFFLFFSNGADKRTENRAQLRVLNALPLFYPATQRIIQEWKFAKVGRSSVSNRSNN